MARRLLLFGVILAVPVVGLFVASAIQLKFNSELRDAVREQSPSTSPDIVAAMTISDLCPSSDTEMQSVCNTYENVEMLGGASIIAGVTGLMLIAVLWLAGVTARKNRTLLLFVFRPGLYLTATLLIVLVLMHAGIAIAALYYGESALVGRVHIGIILAVSLGAIGGAFAIAKHAFALVTNASTAVVGLTLSNKHAPQLWERVNEVARRLNALPPENIVVGLDPNFFVTEAEVRCLSGPCTGRTLYCSLPLARIMTVEEFVGVIGHELGHFKGEDTQFSQRFFPIYRGTANSILALQQTGGDGSGIIPVLPAIALFSYFLECFSVAESRISRDRELVADRAGAEVSSTRAMAVALVKVHAFSGLWERVQEGAAALAGRGQAWINASAVYAATALNAAAYPDILSGVAAAEQPHPTDSHPPLAVRLDALGVTLDSVQQEALQVSPERPAISLLNEPEEIEKQVTDAYQAILHHQLAGSGQAATEAPDQTDR